MYLTLSQTFSRIFRNAKKCRGWVQIQNCPNPKKTKKNRKSETGRCKFAPTCLALPSYQGVSLGKNAKKYTGYCIIVCVPMWLRGKDLVRLAVPGKRCGLTLILAFSDRCGKSGAASSATGSAAPLFQRPPGYELRLFLFTTSHDLRKSLNLCGFPGFGFSWPFTVFDDLAHTCALNVRQKKPAFRPTHEKGQRAENNTVASTKTIQERVHRPTPTAIPPLAQTNKKQASAALRG